MPHPLSLLLLLATLLLSVPNSAASPSPRFQEKQLRNILDALLSGGDFANWAKFLASAKPLPLPVSATLFIPSNAALSAFAPLTAAGLSLDPFLIAYHIVPQHLSFSHLQKLPLHSRLPTLLTTNSILITNNSKHNFTLDDSLITHPDMFNCSGLSVHGVTKILDYKVYSAGNLTFTQQDNDGGQNQRSPRPMPPRNDSSHQGDDFKANSTDVKKSAESGAPSSSSFRLFFLSLVLGFNCV